MRDVVEHRAAHYGTLSFGSGGNAEADQSRIAGGGYAAVAPALLDESDFTAANLKPPRKKAAGDK